MSEEKKTELVRVNTRISARANKWLDKRSSETGIPKSTLILLAIDDYIEQKTVVETMNGMENLVNKLKEVEAKIERIERN